MSKSSLKTKRKVDFDTFLLEVGEFGTYQQRLVVLLCLPGCVMNAYNGYALVFLMFTPEHSCKIPDHNLTSDWSVTAEQCHLRYDFRNETQRREKCDEWNYNDQYFSETVITKFNLVCDQEITGKVVLSIIAAVAVLGCLMYSYIADRWGRKTAFLINLATFLVGGVSCLFMPNLVSFTIVRCLASVNGISTWNICYVWALEYTGPSKRTHITTIMLFGYGLGMASMSLIAFFCRTWVQMGLATTVPFAALISYYFFVSESARWLLSKGRTDEVMKIVESMIKTNFKGKKSLRDFSDTLEALTAPEDEKADPDEVTEGGRPPALIDLFRGPQIRKKTVLVSIAFIACAVLYNTMSYYTEKFEANFYLTWALVSFVEGPAGLADLMLINRFGRIRPLAFSAMGAGTLCLLTVPAQAINKYLVLTLAVFGKLGICMGYGIIFQLGGELFPTVVRGLGIGFGSIIGDIGNISMPYIIYSAQAYEYLPMIIMGIIGITGGALSLFLPETRNRHMPQTLEDAETHGIVSLSTFTSHFRRKPHLGNGADIPTNGLKHSNGV